MVNYSRAYLDTNIFIEHCIIIKTILRNFELIMRLPIFQVDAFTDKVFGGNPAAVCLLENWLSDDVMQQIARENSVAETAFFIPLDEGFEIRWFTPEIEMDLCGHATLAAAHIIARHLNYSLSSIQFKSKSGKLTVSIED